MEFNDYSISDYEYLYMIMQGDHDSMTCLCDLYTRLLWKLSHTGFNQENPAGVGVEDVYQEASIGFREAIFSYDVSRLVGMAHFINHCVGNTVKSTIRKLRSGNHRMVNPRYSLDIPIGENDSLTRIDFIQSNSFSDCPRKMALYMEVRERSNGYLESLKIQEQKVHALREEGFSYSSIAEELKISNKDVDNIVQKIRRNLKDLFA